MKKIILIMITLLFVSACKTQDTQTAQPLFRQGPPHAIGYISHNQILATYESFNKEDRRYHVSKSDLKNVQQIDKPLQLTILFGTWCHDSEREIPRLLKLLKEANNPLISYRLIAVGYDKKVPANVNLPYQIRYTPTIIIEDAKGSELNRIEENPNNNWAIVLLNSVN